MNVYDIRHKVMRGCLSAQEAYELVKANANRPFFYHKRPTRRV